MAIRHPSVKTLSSRRNYEKLDFSLIQPYINYAIEFWHMASQSATSRVHVLLKKSVRAVFNLDYNAHTNEYIKINFILKCNESYEVSLCCYLYKMIKIRNNNYSDQYLRT